MYVKSTVTGGFNLFFFILREPYSPNGKRHLDHNASIDAHFLQEVPFGMSRFAKKIVRVIFAPKNWKKILTTAQASNSSITFERKQIDGKFRQCE
jgi:hypothetical protein